MSRLANASTVVATVGLSSKPQSVRSIGDTARFDALADYKTPPLFTDAERAALDYATELTRDKKVAPETFARLERHYSEREIGSTPMGRDAPL